MSGSDIPRWFVEPLATGHDRSDFSCGVGELDHYLQEQAGQDARKKIAAPFVLTDQYRRIIGFYTLSSYAVRLNSLPPGMIKKLPRYPLVPCILLGRLALDQRYQGKKMGGLLLMDALRRSLKNSRDVASVGVVVDAYNEAARAFYIHHEFVPMVDHPDKLFLAMRTIQKAFNPSIT